MNINFDSRLFNPNFYWVMDSLNNEDLSYVFLYGGSSSGKTYSVVQAIVLSTLTDGADTLIFKKTSASISKSIYKDFVAAIKQLKVSQFFEIYSHSIRCKNGGRIDFAGIVDDERIKGIAGFKRIIIDEITECTPDEFMQVTTRMRGIKNQKLIAMFNPVSETHWLKTDVHDKLPLIGLNTTINNDPKTEVLEVAEYKRYRWIRSSYLNNYYVVGSPDGDWGFKDKAAIDRFEEFKVLDYNHYRVYALGEWGHITEGGEFYKNFKKDSHVGNFDVDIDLPLHISIDENLRPYAPMVICQVDDNVMLVVDEVIGISPQNNFVSVCKIFAERYKKFKNNRIFLYGDATSRKGDTRSELGYNLFQLVESELKKLGFLNIEIRVSNINPSVSISGVFMNRVLAGLEDNTILINAHCINTINDFLYLKEDANGNALKEHFKANDKFKGEKYGHCSDAVRYFVIKYMEQRYKEFTNRGQGNYTEITISLLDNPDFLQF